MSTAGGQISCAGQPERARPLGAEAVQRARQLGDDELPGMSLDAYAMAVDVAATGPLYAEAFACAERSGDLGAELTLHNNAGVAALEMGDIPGARAHIEAAIRTAEALGTPHPAQSASLGMILRAEHDLDDARSALQEALRVGRRIGVKRIMAEAMGGWRSWTATWATGTGQPCCTAPRRPCSTRPELRGTPSTCPTARKASTRQARPWVMSSSGEPTSAA